VSDYKPRVVSLQKIKKSDTVLALELEPTVDILATVSREPRDFLVVGFAAETNNVEENAREKLQRKACDVLIANDVSDARIGMESDENEVTIFFRDGEIKKISRASKKKIARELVKIFEKIFEKGLTKKSW
jgi:phosphopantothenoylcysteine decarboxylase/phosphopantothenate--cysteine ligase